MDVFRFLNPTHPTLLGRGKLINGLKSKMWIERYRDPGEFEFTAKIEKDAQIQLPVGCLISHVGSTEVMMVENHEISEDPGSDTEVKITGRSFEAFLENRIVGANKDFPTDSSATLEYTLLPDYSWIQSEQMIKDHIYESNLFDPDDALPNVAVISTVTGTGVQEDRSIKRGDLHSSLLELLAVDDLGIKNVRPGPLSPLGWSNSDLAMVIHQGLDLRSEVYFSHLIGEVDNADYLWTNKAFKNAALISGRWIETTVKAVASGYDRRVMLVDGSDIDSSFTAAPTGSDRDLVLAIMQARGRALLLAQRNVVLVKTEATKNSTMYKYRENYDLGDIVTVEGQHSETAAMQVTEYVEIEDENGETGYPTLSGI